MTRIPVRIVQLLALIPLIAGTFVLNGCGSDEETESKSMQAIYDEKGVPVTVDTVKTEPFKKHLAFYAMLQGETEVMKGAAVDDYVKKVNARVGDYVNEGDIIVEFPTDNIQMQYEQAKAAFENSEKTYDRMKRLLEAGEIAEAQFDGAETKYLVDKRNFEQIKQALFIKAPINGVVVEMFAEEGHSVRKEDPLFKVASLNNLKATIWVTETEIGLIKRGSKAFITTGDRRVAGRVTKVSLAMDEYRRAFAVEIVFPNNGRQLYSGVTADIQLSVYENPEAVVVPRNVILERGDEHFVYLAKNGKAQARKIELGEESDIDIEVTSGLQPGELLIVEGMTRLDDGQKLNITN